MNFGAVRSWSHAFYAHRLPFPDRPDSTPLDHSTAHYRTTTDHKTLALILAVIGRAETTVAVICGGDMSRSAATRIVVR